MWYLIVIFPLDFDNFVRHYSTQFISRFFALFPCIRIVGLYGLSSLAHPLFLDHPALFNSIILSVECLDTFQLGE